MRKRETVCGDEKEYVNIIVTGDMRERRINMCPQQHDYSARTLMLGAHAIYAVAMTHPVMQRSI